MRRYLESIAACRRRRPLTASLVWVTAVSWTLTARASQIVLQNDSVNRPGSGNPLAVFLPRETVAARLTTPVAGDVMGVRVFWDSLLGSNPPSQTRRHGRRSSRVVSFPLTTSH